MEARLRGERCSVPERAIIYLAHIALGIRARAVFDTLYAQHQIQRLALSTNSCYIMRLHISIFGLCWYLQGCGNVAVRRSVSLSDARANSKRWLDGHSKSTMFVTANGLKISMLGDFSFFFCGDSHRHRSGQAATATLAEPQLRYVAVQERECDPSLRI
jgi:hypothetical protein